VKRAYLTNGYLTQQASPKDNLLYVDSATYDYLSGLLGVDYCYLMLNTAEVVKVLGVTAPNTLMVVRDVEGTERKVGLVGASIRYAATASETVDAVQFTGYRIKVGYTLRLIDGVLSYGPVNIDTLGGVSIDGTLESGWYIRDIPDNMGCLCGEGGDIPLPIPYIYSKYRITDDQSIRVMDDGSYRGYQ
jgi:hypothetical protein